jgi:hypothetical protein
VTPERSTAACLFHCRKQAPRVRVNFHPVPLRPNSL